MCVSPILAPSHIYREELQGLHTANATEEALGTDLVKLPGSYTRRLEVSCGAHQSADHPGRPTIGSHHGPPPLARKLPGGSLWSM